MLKQIHSLVGEVKVLPPPTEKTELILSSSCNNKTIRNQTAHFCLSFTLLEITSKRSKNNLFKKTLRISHFWYNNFHIFNEGR